MIRFETNLSSKSLESLMNDLNIYGKKLQQAQEDVIQAFAEYVYDRIMLYAPYKTGQLMSSFVMETAYYYSFATARVYTDLFYAKYVEFGTGIKGTKSNYDSKRIGIESLTYSSDVQGQKAKKFVYKAVLDLERDYVEIAKNVLRKKGLI